MEKGSIILSLLFPANQDAAKSVQPTMRSFNNPTPCSKSSFLFQGLGLLTTRSNVSCKSKLLEGVSDLQVIVSFIQTHSLRTLLGRFRAVCHDVLNRFSHQFHVVPVSSFDGQTDRDAVSFGQQAAFGSLFFPDRWGYCLYPHRPTALSSSLHPDSTNPTQFLSTRRTAQPLSSTISGTLPLSPIPEIDRGRSNQNTDRSDPELSIGSRFASHKISRPHTSDLGRVGAHPQNDAYSYALAITAVSPPTTRLIFENPSSFCCSAFAPVFASFPSSLFLLSYSKFTRVIRIGSYPASAE